jgi:hypothetical protein
MHAGSGKGDLWMNWLALGTRERSAVFSFHFSSGEGSKSESESQYDRQSVSQYVLVSSPIWNFWPKIFFRSYCLVFLGRPLWREVGSVICQSLLLQSTIASHYLQQIFTLNWIITFCITHIYNAIKYLQFILPSFSPGSVQQIMPYLLVT